MEGEGEMRRAAASRSAAVVEGSGAHGPLGWPVQMLGLGVTLSGSSPSFFRSPRARGLLGPPTSSRGNQFTLASNHWF
jgi:hypothetical protein